MNIIDYIRGNSFLSFLIIFLLFLLVVLMVLKLSDIKIFSKKTSEKKEDNKTEVTQKDIEKPEEQKEEKKGFIRIFKKKEKPSHVKKVERVYQREEKKEEKNESNKFSQVADREEEFLKKMQFVNTGKSVSKLVMKEENLDSEPTESEFEIDEVGEDDVKEYQPAHFDKSIRMSRYIEDNEKRDMFCSHIKSDYLNIDEHRHICDENCLGEHIFARTSSMLANSMTRVLLDPNDPNSRILDTADVESKRREEMASLLENMKSDENVVVDEEILYEDDVDLSLKNILLTEAVMNRKRK